MEDAAACDRLDSEVWSAAYDLRKILHGDKPDVFAVANAAMLLQARLASARTGHRGISIDGVRTANEALAPRYRIRCIDEYPRKYILERRTQQEQWQ
jgi:hypothetical protein